MGLFAGSADVQIGIMDMGDAAFRTRIIYGIDSSLMIAERPPGYHSRPHRHDCEQLNILERGELYIYTTEGAYLLRPGDALRIKPNLIHWSWNRADVDCVLIEVHTPGIQNDPKLAEFATALLDTGEAPSTDGPTNMFPPFPAEEIARIEALEPTAEPTPRSS